MALPFIIELLELQEEREFCVHHDVLTMADDSLRLQHWPTKDTVRWLCGGASPGPEEAAYEHENRPER